MDIAQLSDRFLAEAREDYVGLWQIFNAAERADAERAREITLEIVRRLLGGGVRPCQSPYKADSVQLWPEQTEQEILRRIETEWDASGAGPSMLDVWFSLETP